MKTEKYSVVLRGYRGQVGSWWGYDNVAPQDDGGFLLMMDGEPQTTIYPGGLALIVTRTHCCDACRELIPPGHACKEVNRRELCYSCYEKQKES